MTWLFVGPLLGLLWWGAGVGGFVYWWTSEWNLESADLAVGLFIGACLGPLAWLVGGWVHGGGRKVWMGKRG